MVDNGWLPKPGETVVGLTREKDLIDNDNDEGEGDGDGDDEFMLMMISC